MAKVTYDEETDALSIDFSAKKTYASLEVSAHFVVDVAATNQPTGIELLNASEVLGKLFGFKVKKSDLHKLSFNVNKEAIEKNEELYATFQLGEKQARVLIPTNYQSPVAASG